jgi:hypothetical protein
VRVSASWIGPICAPPSTIFLAIACSSFDFV